MASKVWQNLDFISASRIINLPAPVAGAEPATKAYVDSAIEGLNWKESVRVATDNNIDIAEIGTAVVSGITLVAGDRLLVKNQTLPEENGIYVFDTSATPLVRSLDANIFSELEQAVVSVEEGVHANISFRQTVVDSDGVIDITSLTFVSFGSAAPSATESIEGLAEIATQAEVDAGTDDTKFITPLKLAEWSGKIFKFTDTIGDGVETVFTITHNFNTRDLHIAVFYNSGDYEEILVEKKRPTVNTVEIEFSVAPTTDQFKVVIIG